MTVMLSDILLMFLACAVISFVTLLAPRLSFLPMEQRHLQIFYLPVAVIGLAVCNSSLTSVLEFITYLT